VVPEAPLERTGNGLAPAGEGWFVLNARDARWLEGELTDFAVGLTTDGQPIES
jgi:hypothetical protein